ncbi:unnamed protein product [Caenorhabditis brenneri]
MLSHFLIFFLIFHSIDSEEMRTGCEEILPEFSPYCSAFSRLIIQQYDKLTAPNFHFLTHAKFDIEIDNVCLRYKHCATRVTKHNCFLPRLHDEVSRICEINHLARGDFFKCIENIHKSDPQPDEFINKMFLDSSSGITRRQCQFLKESNSIEKITEVILANCGPHAERNFKHHYHVVFPPTICKSGIDDTD